MRVLLFLALLVPGLAAAQFSGYACVPGIYGTTLDVAAPKRSDSGWRLVWLCRGSQGEIRISTLVCLHGTCVESTLRNAYIGATQSANPEAAIKAEVAKFGSTSCRDSSNAALRTLCDVAWADGQAMAVAYRARNPLTPPAPEPPPPPAEVWTVAALGTSKTRPTRIWPYEYTVGGAIRSAAERVDVGATCDPSVGDQTSNWRGVLGRPDRVALCVKQ